MWRTVLVSGLLIFSSILQYQRVEKLREALEAKENYRKYLDTDAGEGVANTKEFECLICVTLTPPGDGLVLRDCLHEFCKYDCVCSDGLVLKGLPGVTNSPQIRNSVSVFSADLCLLFHYYGQSLQYFQVHHHTWSPVNLS